MVASQAKQAWVSSLTETMPLTPLDYTAPQNYIMRSLGFPFPSSSESDRQAAVKHLESRLELVFSLLPFLAGQIIHPKEGELPRLVYPGPSTSPNLSVFRNEVFADQIVDASEFSATFAELLDLGIPADIMTKDRFWLLPQTGPAPGDTCHPVTLKVSFINGGLILGFSFHHGVMDGTGTAAFFKYFATGALDGLDTLDITNTMRQHKQAFIDFAAATAKATLVDPRSLPGYDFNTPPTPPTLPPAIAKILTINSATANALHVVALDHLRSAHNNPQAFVSRSDVLCALVWVHVTRARLGAGRIDPADPTTFSTAVNVRSKIPLAGRRWSGKGEDYVGNMWLRALASTTVGELVRDTKLAERATSAQIADAAWCIRCAIAEMSDPAVLARHLAVATQATADGATGAAGGSGDDGAPPALSWPEVDAAVRRKIARHHTGLDASVGVGLGADLEYDIPHVEGGKRKAAWMRRAYVPYDGAMNILPRRGGTGGDEDWEVWLGLRKEDMDVLTSKGELGQWLCLNRATG